MTEGTVHQPEGRPEQPWKMEHIIQTPHLIRGADMAHELAQKPAALDSAPLDQSRVWDVEMKIDGICGLYIDGRMVTLEGTPLDCATHCIPALAEMERLAGMPLFFHGEYVEPAGFDATISAFKSRKGIGSLFLHDMVPLNIWQSGRRCELARRERRHTLEQLVKKVACPWVGFITSREVKGRDLVRTFQQYGAMGAEGMVIKDPHGFYERRRGGGWFKMKCANTLDVHVIDLLIKNSSPAGMMVKTSAGRTMKVVMGVGRSEWQELEAALAAGKAPIVEILEQQRVGAKNGGSPALVRLRHDRRW